MGGSGRVAYELARQQATAGHTISVITRRWRKEDPEFETHDNITIYRYEAVTSGPFRLAFSAKQSVKTIYQKVYSGENPDQIQIHQPLSSLGLLPEIKKHSIPVVYFFYAPWTLEYISGKPSGRSRTPQEYFRSLFLSSMERAAVKASSRVVVLSRFSEEQFSQWHSTKGKTIIRSRTGVDLNHFSPGDKVTSRESLGLPVDKRILFTMRNLRPRMGLEDLLEAFKRLSEEDRNMLLIVAGQGPHESMLRMLVSKWDLEEQVNFTGYINEDTLPCYYRAADLFLLPNIEREGFGMVISEALACGTPVVGTPTGAVPEILYALEPKLLCPSTGAEAIYATVHNFFRIERSREDWAQICRNYAERHFSWQSLVDAIQ